MVAEPNPGTGPKHRFSGRQHTFRHFFGLGIQSSLGPSGGGACKTRAVPGRPFYHSCEGYVSCYCLFRHCLPFGWCRSSGPDLLGTCTVPCPGPAAYPQPAHSCDSCGFCYFVLALALALGGGSGPYLLPAPYLRPVLFPVLGPASSGGCCPCRVLPRCVTCRSLCSSFVPFFGPFFGPYRAQRTNYRHWVQCDRN